MRLRAVVAGALVILLALAGILVYAMQSNRRATDISIATALAQIRLPNRRPIHVLPVAWSVDGSRGVRDPRAMRGASLGLDLLVVSMAEGVFATLSHCLELAHLDLQGVAAAPVTASLAALEEDEMDLGCVAIDMGGGSTSAAVWGGGSLLHVESLNVGGDHVTSDIARGLSTGNSSTLFTWPRPGAWCMKTTARSSDLAL